MKRDAKFLRSDNIFSQVLDYMEAVEYISPEKFEEYRNFALKLGFSFVESSPLVRSSFHAENHVKAR